MSIARRVPPSKLELNRRAGSERLAPRAKVSFTAFLYVSPVQTIPLCDQTGTPAGFDGFFHFRSSIIWGSASMISARMRARVSARQLVGAFAGFAVLAAGLAAFFGVALLARLVIFVVLLAIVSPRFSITLIRLT